MDKILGQEFKGMPQEEIDVKIYADVDGRNVSLALVSPGAEGLLEEYRNKVIDEEIAKIKGLAPDNVFFEK